MADIVIRNPGYLYWLTEKHVWDAEEAADDYERQLRADIANFHSLQARFRSRQDQPFSARMLAALCRQFGGHPVREAK